MKTSKSPSAKPVKAWAIIDKDGAYWTVSTFGSRKFTWQKFVTAYNATEESLKKFGYRCIRVQILPLPPHNDAQS